ncbi:MAG: hypothetical protein L3K13_02040 [Thermoplasmata archaeon]|nr:hypothetical protein [Thermoplasmata archaeon]
MANRPETRAWANGSNARRWRAALFATLLLAGFAAAAGSTFAPAASHAAHLGPVTAAQNGSASGSSSGSAASLCPSGGPVILGIEWNCVAVLNLSEVAILLAGIGIIAYVFRGDDEAELPGEATEVPVTAEEWEVYRESRRRGLPYRPPPTTERPEER